MAGLEQGFAGDTTDPQARPTEFAILVDASGIHAQLSSPNCRHVSSWTAPQNDQIMLYNSHRHALPFGISISNFDLRDKCRLGTIPQTACKAYP